MDIKWTKEFELEYWKAHNVEFYRDAIKLKWDLFGTSEILKRLLNNRINTAIDIGGGRVGGALGFIKAEYKILVDALADDFMQMGDLPPNTVCRCSDFATIDITSAIADVVFAWNVFDHARDINHFYQGVWEALRLLAAGGLFFGTFPLRKRPREGHPIALDVLDVEKVLCDLKLIRSFEVREPFYDDKILFVMAMK